MTPILPPPMRGPRPWRPDRAAPGPCRPASPAGAAGHSGSWARGAVSIRGWPMAETRGARPEARGEKPGCSSREAGRSMPLASRGVGHRPSGRRAIPGSTVHEERRFGAAWAGEAAVARVELSAGGTTGAAVAARRAGPGRLAAQGTPLDAPRPARGLHPRGPGHRRPGPHPAVGARPDRCDAVIRHVLPIEVEIRQGAAQAGRSGGPQPSFQGS